MAKGKAKKLSQKAEKKAVEPIEEVNNLVDEEFYDDNSDPLEWSEEDDIEDSEDDSDISEDDSDISENQDDDDDDDDDDEDQKPEDSEVDSESVTETESESEDSENEVDLTDALMDTKLSDNDEEDISKKSIQNGAKPSHNEDDLDDLKAKKSSGGGFQTMGLIPPVLNAILKKGFKVPTPIQRKCIPLIMDGVDVVGMARTGSGKTAAFAIPLVDKLKLHSAKVGVRGIILSPNRELALQTTKVVVELSKFTDLRIVSIVGGEKLEDQFGLLTGNPDIIIATPGRLLHLLVETSMELSRVEYIVFDECDRLFEMGFSIQLNEILAKLPTKRQTLLFSATLPKNLIEFAKAGLQDPTLVRLDADTKISSDLELGFFYTKPDYKEAALLYLLRTVVKCPMKHEVDHLRVKPQKNEIGAKKKSKKTDLPPLYNKQAIIFACTKHHVEYLADLLEKAGYEVGYLYGSLDQTARQIQINRFRQQQVAFFVTTDVAARGIDIPVLDYVVNYDFVDSSKVFVHRVGRVARAGKRGWAYSLVTPDELPYFLDLQLFLGRPLVTGAQLLRTEAAPSYNSDLVIGNLGTENSMDVDIEWVNNRLDKDVTLEGLKGVAQNGYKMFRKSRAQLTAAKPSITRAKELIKTGELTPIHPLVRAAVPQESIEHENFLQSLSKFRPSETIFEIGARGTKKTTAGSIIMQTRRAILTNTINDFKEKNEERIAKLHEADRANLRSTTVDDTDEAALESAFTNIVQPSKKNTRNTGKDDKHYIGYVQKDANTEKGYSLSTGISFAEQTQHAYVDFKSDDKDDLNKMARNQLRWDSKKKKFVRGTGVGSDNKKLITTESGAKLPASFKSGKYQEWQQKTRTKMPRIGEVELDGGAEALENMRQKRKFKHHSTTPAKSDGPNNKRSKSELKSVDQIVKERKLKEMRREKTGRHKGSKYTAQDQGKGGKGGNNKGKPSGNKSFGGSKSGGFGGSKPKGKGQNQGKFKGKVKRKF